MNSKFIIALLLVSSPFAGSSKESKGSTPKNNPGPMPMGDPKPIRTKAKFHTVYDHFFSVLIGDASQYSIGLLNRGDVHWQEFQPDEYSGPGKTWPNTVLEAPAPGTEFEGSAYDWGGAGHCGFYSIIEAITRLDLGGHDKETQMRTLRDGLAQH